MPPHQRFGNWLAATLMRGLYRVQVTDLGPYRAIRRDLLGELDMCEMTFGWPTEMMVKAARRGARIHEVPVSYLARDLGALESGRQPARLHVCGLSDLERHAAVCALSGSRQPKTELHGVAVTHTASATRVIA